MAELQAELQRVSGTTRDAQGAANSWAGTTDLELVGALNAKAGSSGLELEAVLRRLIGSARGSPDPAFLTTVSPNLLTPNQASLETDTTGWVVSTNATIARSTAQFLDGAASLAITAVAVGVTAVRTPTGTSGVPVVGRKLYTAKFSSRAATVGRATRARIFWYTAAGAAASTANDNGATTANITTGWTEHVLTVIAPADAAYASVDVQNTDAATLATEVHFVDRISLVET